MNERIKKLMEQRNAALANNINSTLDVKDVMNEFARELEDCIAANVEGVHA